MERTNWFDQALCILVISSRAYENICKVYAVTFSLNILQYAVLVWAALFGTTEDVLKEILTYTRFIDDDTLFEDIHRNNSYLQNLSE